MATTLAQLAELVGGVLVGEGSMELHGAAVLESAVAGEITFIDHADKARRLSQSQATAVVVPTSVTTLTNLPGIIVDDVHGAFATIVCHFRPRRSAGPRGISPTAHIAPSARLGENVAVHANATIGEDVVIASGATIHSGVHILAGCQIGPDVTIMPGAVLHEDTIVGARTMIHAGVVLGTHGFGYETIDGRHVPSAQLGYVEIEDDVEIGANTTIDRGTYGRTLIGAGTKIDNLVQIAHNCRIGRHHLICGHVGIAGSTTTGDYVVMAGQVGVRDHVTVGAGAIVGAQAGVSNDVPAGAFVLGSPAVPMREQKLKLAAESKLPEMRKEFRALQRVVEQLQQAIEQSTSERRIDAGPTDDTAAAA